MYALIRATSKKHHERSKASSSGTPPQKNSDDASISLSSWACLDTENQNSVDRILNPRLHSSDAVINYNHVGPISTNKNRKPQPARDDDASISMSSWANITTEVQNEEAAAKSRRLCASASDRAIDYNASSHRPPISTKKRTCPPTPRNSVSSKTGHHSKEDSWGQMDVLFMANIVECREEAAKELMKNRQIDNKVSQERKDKEYHIQPRTVAADSGTPTRRRSSTNKRGRKLPPRWKGRTPSEWRSVQTKRVF